jgi:hypothetical protein
MFLSAGPIRDVVYIRLNKIMLVDYGFRASTAVSYSDDKVNVYPTIFEW